MVVAKESDVTERTIHTGGEQIQGNETHTFGDRGRDSAKTGEGEWASWTAQALFAWTRTHDELGKSGTYGYIAAGLLRDDVSFGHRFAYSRVARKRKFSTLSLRSAVENGSVSPLVTTKIRWYSVASCYRTLFVLVVVTHDLCLHFLSRFGLCLWYRHFDGLICFSVNFIKVKLAIVVFSFRLLQFELINPKKMKKKKRYQNSGILVLESLMVSVRCLKF